MNFMKKKPVICAAVLVFVFMFTVTAPLMAAEKHTVKSGETLYSISKKYGTTVIELKRANGLNKDLIYAGQHLRIPVKTNVSRGASSFSEDDIYWLARAVYGEARGESYEGQVAVAAVIINRVESPDFPNSVRGVIFEPLAFTAVADGQIYYTPNSTAIKAVREAINGWDPSGGALYYWNPVKATSKWIWSRPIIKQIGNHVFAK